MKTDQREYEVADRYMKGECNEIQLNYLIHTEGLDPKLIDRIIDETTYRTPIATASKFLLACVFAQFAVILLHPFFFRGMSPDPFLHIAVSSPEMTEESTKAIPELRSIESPNEPPPPKFFQKPSSTSSARQGLDGN